MNENTKILVLAGLVLVVAIVSFNLDITGKVTGDETTITVSPSRITFDRDEGGSILESDANKQISVAFKNIDSKGLKKCVELHDADTGLRRNPCFLTICNRDICTPNELDGKNNIIKTPTISAELTGGSYYLQAERNIGFNQPDKEHTSNTFTVE